MAVVDGAFFLILLTFALIFLVPLLLFYAYVLCSVWLYELRTYVCMRRKGRFLRLIDAKRSIAESTGTLIVEYPWPGFRYTHAWWTPDDVVGKLPFANDPNRDGDNSAFELHADWNQWCWDNYLAPDTGCGFLLQVWDGKELESRLLAEYPDLKTIRTLSDLPRLGIGTIHDDRKKEPNK